MPQVQYELSATKMHQVYLQNKFLAIGGPDVGM